MVNIYSEHGNIKYNVIDYMLDSIEDLDTLKEIAKHSAPGSSAFIIATSELYILNSKREWVTV